MRAVAVHPDAIVVTSRIWQTNAIALRSGGEVLLIDSPYFPDELEALPALLRQAGFAPGGSLDDYRATLARLAPLVERVETVVPGHGGPHTREEALRILDEDVDYLDALERGEERPKLPKGRDTARQREIHLDNLTLLA